MKLLIEEYAQAVIAVLVAVALLMIFTFAFFTSEGSLFKPIREMCENRFSVEENSQSAFWRKKNVVASEVALLTGKELFTGQRYQVASLIKMAGSGAANNVCVEGAFNENFLEKAIQTYDNGQTFSASTPGVYWLSVKVTEESGITYKRWIKLFINGGVA